MSISRYVSWDPITKVMDLQTLSYDQGMLNSHGKATAMRMPHHGCTAWIFNARKSLSSTGWRGALHRRTDLANFAFNDTKRTLFHPERRQSCKSLRGTVLSSSVLASQAWNNKYIHSGASMSLRATQEQASSFRDMLLVTVGPSKPLSATSVPQATPSRPQSHLKLRESAATMASIRSSDVLLEELTAIASEVTGTNISADAPLMDSGLDSIGATELSNKISAHLNTELSPTLLFDHPSLRSIADALSANSYSSPTQEFESK